MFTTLPALLLAQLREEVHFEGLGELGRGTEGERHVLAEDLGDVGTRDVHPAGEVGLVEPQLTHPAENPAEKRRADVVDGCHQDVL